MQVRDTLIEQSTTLIEQSQYSKGPLLVKKNPPFKIPGYGPATHVFRASILQAMVFT